MTDNNGYDLFSYFGGSDSFAEPSAATVPQEEKEKPKPGPATIQSSPQADVECESTSNVVSDECKTNTTPNKVVYLASQRLRDQKDKTVPEDACEPVSEDEQFEDTTITDNENESDSNEDDELEEETVEDEGAADRAELGGTIVKSDEKKTVSDPKADGKKEEKRPVFNHSTYICYAGNNLSITKLFNEEVLATMDLEAVRKRLEKDFPELSKQRTKMDFDEKKNIIVPMVTGGKKGCSFFTAGLKGFFFHSKDLHANKEPINILAANDGYYEVRENMIGVFVSKVPVVQELESCREGFKFSLPKIPERLFAKLVTFFSDYAMHEVEVMGVYYWDTVNQKYLLDVPNQIVSKISVDARYTEFPPHIIKVAEIHSVARCS